jgi:tRNA (adenine22-N1)-methyltransferase
MDLTPRLAAVGALVPAGSRFADVCCDHAQLAIWLQRSRLVSAAVAVDVASAPLVLARKNARAAGIELDLRQADGLEGLRPGEVDCVAIAGVGGDAAIRILEPHRLDALGLNRLVVQVNKKIASVRKHLIECGWAATDETVVRSGRRIFVTCAFERGAFVPDPIDLLIGPLIRARAGALEDELIAAQLHWLVGLEAAAKIVLPISVGVTSEMLLELQSFRSRPISA